MEFLLDIVKEIGIPGLFDIAFMSLLIYMVLVLFNRTKTRFVLTGIIIIGIVYLLSRQFNLILTTSVLQAFFAVILIALIIIFQEEIRNFFEQIAVWSLNPQFRFRNPRTLIREDIDILANTVSDLSGEKIGALIVIPGKSTIDRYIEGGTKLNGKLSEELLRSLFDPHSSGHDGAIVVNSGVVESFSCHLPLSKNFELLRHKGTRHAAALGLSEVSDALCLVVSEERGTISVTRNGEIRQVANDQISLIVERFLSEIKPLKIQSHWYDIFTRNYKEKTLAILMSMALWFVFVHESELVYRSFAIPVKYTTLPEELTIEQIKPDYIKVTFLGPRRAFYFFNEREVELYLKIPNPQKGMKTLNISESSISFPKNITLEEIEPRRVDMRIGESEPKNND